MGNPEFTQQGKTKLMFQRRLIFLKEIKRQQNGVNVSPMQARGPLFHNLVTLGDTRGINSISLPGRAHFSGFFIADGDDLISPCPS